MEAFTTLTAAAAPYFHADVDTDEIIPHRFLRKPLSAGYGNFLFHDRRFRNAGQVDAGFVLNRREYAGAQVLVCGRNFGCGSTREGAVYALRDYGIRALIAPSFAEIFSGNCVQNGVLPVVLPEATVQSLCAQITARPGAEVAIDLMAQTVALPEGERAHFDIDAGWKARLIEGLDEIGITLKHREAIAAFEAAYRARLPWLARQERPA
ncbi:MAG TPA: 3-isopropylmalate dehydratase small subunit [Burkholderiales bacterium]|nr:3-isopropylmalate dehydratase small subunit [Burkholderiales bacterium]